MQKIMQKKDEKRTFDDTVVRSVNMSSGYKLSQALSGKNFNPSLVDEWYKSQRKSSLKYAKDLAAG